jgi:hypothetical protein
MKQYIQEFLQRDALQRYHKWMIIANNVHVEIILYTIHTLLTISVQCPPYKCVWSCITFIIIISIDKLHDIKLTFIWLWSQYQFGQCVVDHSQVRHQGASWLYTTKTHVSCEQDPIQNYNHNIGNKTSKRFFNYEFKH